MFRSLFWQRFAIAVSLVLLMTMSLPLTMAPQAAFAQSSTVSINPAQGPAGTHVTGSGTNWTAGDSMQVSWADDGSILANTTVQSNGTFTVYFTIPSSAGLGGHNIYFTDLSSRYFLVAVFTVGTVDLKTLRIVALQLPAVGSSPTFRAYIQNKGTIASGNFNIQWIADGTNLYGGHYSIPAGAVDTHDHIWSNLTAGQHTLTFIANFDKMVKETNYNNNKVTITFTGHNTVASNPYPDSSQCTWFAEEKMHNKTGFYMPNFGDAHSWRDNAGPNGWTVGTAPETSSVMVMQYADANGNPYNYSYWNGSQWVQTTINQVGHVAWVTSKRNSGAEVYIVDRNWGNDGKDGGRWMRISGAPVNFIYSSH